MSRHRILKANAININAKIKNFLDKFEIYNKENTIGGKTNVEPKSGCKKINEIGIITINSILNKTMSSFHNPSKTAAPRIIPKICGLRKLPWSLSLCNGLTRLWQNDLEPIRRDL